MKVESVSEYAKNTGEHPVFFRTSAGIYRERLPVYVFYNGEFHLTDQNLLCVIHGEGSPKSISELTAERRAITFAHRRVDKNIDYNKKLKNNVKSLISRSFSRACKGKFKQQIKSEIILGINLDAFLVYISSLFKKGMTIENHGSWHIDHIKPLRLAKSEEDIIELNHYTNLQPLWALENHKKQGNYEY